MKKYELTTNTKVVFGRKLFRIKALIAFGDVEVGELGGFIEKEGNLDQDGSAWVYGDADHLLIGPDRLKKRIHYFLSPKGWRNDGSMRVFSRQHQRFCKACAVGARR